MKNQTETFEKKIQRFQFHYDTRTVFDDFLTMTLCAFSQNPAIGKSHDEDLYLETIAKYKDNDLRFEFPKLLTCLTDEMTERIDSDTGNDVLGEFYEQNLQRNGLSQFFTPWPICTFMAKSTLEATSEDRKDQPLRILEPACGSGRMLMAMLKVAGPYHEYYAIDLDQTCVKMTALNLFLSGLFRSETLCANALLPEDFRVSYRTSFLPFGIFRVKEKEQSRLWHLLKNSWNGSKEKEAKKEPPEFVGKQIEQGNQLTIF
jgi:type I restriction-modification system DNA methylase subunit